MSENSIANPNVNATSGAGIQAAQQIAGEGAKALITGNIGPNAMQTLSAARIDVYQYHGVGSVRDAIEKLKRGELVKITDASVPAHPGMGPGGQGMGRRGGQGKGRGGGGGRGRGGGQGAGRGGEF